MGAPWSRSAASAGVRRSQNTCSCMRVAPSASGSINPVTVWILPRSCCRSMRSPSIQNRDGARPTGGRAADLNGKAADRESRHRQRLEVVQLLEVAVADLAAGLVAFPDQAGIAGLAEFFLGVHEGRVPAPGVGAGDA